MDCRNHTDKSERFASKAIEYQATGINRTGSVVPSTKRTMTLHWAQIGGSTDLGCYPVSEGSRQVDQLTEQKEVGMIVQPRPALTNIWPRR
jgi:hypothetical protein